MASASLSSEVVLAITHTVEWICLAASAEAVRAGMLGSQHSELPASPAQFVPLGEAGLSGMLGGHAHYQKMSGEQLEDKGGPRELRFQTVTAREAGSSRYQSNLLICLFCPTAVRRISFDEDSLSSTAGMMEAGHVPRFCQYPKRHSIGIESAKSAVSLLASASKA